MSEIKSIDTQIDSLKKQREKALRDEKASAEVEEVERWMQTPLVKGIKAALVKHGAKQAEKLRKHLYHHIDKQTENAKATFQAELKKVLPQGKYIRESQLPSMLKSVLKEDN